MDTQLPPQQNTPKEISTQQPSNTSQELSKNPFIMLRKVIICITILLLLIPAISFSIFLRLHSKNTNTNNVTTKKSAEHLQTKTMHVQNVLVPYVPNFDHLTLADLPSISSYGSLAQIFPYKNTLLVVGQNKIIQVDASSKKVLRMNNTQKFDCVSQGALIGDNLYTFCQDADKNNPTKNKRGIYILNLEKNEITQEYIDQEPTDDGGHYVFSLPDSLLTLANANLAIQGTTLWVGTWNRVIQLNTLNGRIQTYTSSQLGFTGKCQSFSVGANNKFVYTAPAENSTCTHGGISLYRPKTNTWKRYIENSFPTDGRQDMSFDAIGYSKDNLFVSYNNGYLSNGQPIYAMTMYDPQTDTWKKVLDYSNDVNGYTAYASTTLKSIYFPYHSTAGIDTALSYDYFDINTGAVTKYQPNLPQHFTVSNQVNSTYYLFSTDGVYKLTPNTFPILLRPEIKLENGIGTKAFVSSDQMYALLLGQNSVVGYVDVPEVKLINLSSGRITDISSVIKGHNTSYLPKTIFKEIPNGVIVEDASGKLIFKIDFPTQQISFK